MVSVIYNTNILLQYEKMMKKKGFTLIYKTINENKKLL